MSPQMSLPLHQASAASMPQSKQTTNGHPGSTPQSSYHAGQLPVTLSPPLPPREAAADSLHRFMIGMDTNDATLFDSAFTPEARWDLRGKQIVGLRAIHSQCFDFNMTKLDTTHYATSLRVNLSEDGKKAQMTALYTAHHFRLGTGKLPGAPRYSTGGTYYIESMRDEEVEGLWRIELFRMVPLWTEGTFEVMGHSEFPKIVDE